MIRKTIGNNLKSVKAEITANVYLHFIFSIFKIKITKKICLRLRYKVQHERHPPTSNASQFTVSNASNCIYPPNPYGDAGYLQMALGAYLTPSGSGYKSVDPYFLSQGNFSDKLCRTIAF